MVIFMDQNIRLNVIAAAAKHPELDCRDRIMSRRNGNWDSMHQFYQRIGVREQASDAHDPMKRIVRNWPTPSARTVGDT